jgi:N-formylglutamate deformylase
MSIVVHSPHASVLIPDDVRSRFCVSSAEIDRELILMTDRFTDDLFCLDIPGVDHLLYDASRLVVDPERFRSDADETMAQREWARFTCVLLTVGRCATI